MDRRDIIWITLESTRQDRTSLSAHERDTTPFLAELASDSDSAAFDNCTSHAIWTRPSTASILTGRAPSDHRVWSGESALSDRITTIPEQLRERGYCTVGISPNPQFSAATGLDRGFEHFHYLNKDELLSEAGVATTLRYLANVRRHSAGLTADTRKHCLGYVSDAIARRHIRRAAEEDAPLFLYAHLGDSHHAYYPPGGWRNRFADDLDTSMDRALSASLDMSARLHEHIANGVPFDEETWNAIEVMYDSCLAYVDSLVESIVETARDRLDDPLIVVTADHGEFFGEEGLLAHMLATHTAVTDVPLVVAGMDVPADAASGLVQHADAMQMVSAKCGLGLDVPLGTDVRETQREFAFTQRGDVRSAKKLEHISKHNAEFDASNYPAGVLTNLRTADYRYQRTETDADLFALPNESTDVSAEQSSRAAEFDAQMDRWLEAHGQPTDPEAHSAEFSQGMQQQLEDLGYL